MSFRKWKPSKSRIREFAQKMDEIDEFCQEHNISQSSSSDSYYFTINDKYYRVSNHSCESSPYHQQGCGMTRKDYDQVIHASKTRIIEIYNDLKAGYELDGHGNRIKKEI